jgi:hypothetical protein
MIQSRQGAVMAQLRRIFYCSINLAITLTAHAAPYYRHKIRKRRGSPPRFRADRIAISAARQRQTIKAIAKKSPSIQCSAEWLGRGRQSHLT